MSLFQEFPLCIFFLNVTFTMRKVMISITMIAKWTVRDGAFDQNWRKVKVFSEKTALYHLLLVVASTSFTFTFTQLPCFTFPFTLLLDAWASLATTQAGPLVGDTCPQCTLVHTVHTFHCRSDTMWSGRKGRLQKKHRHRRNVTCHQFFDYHDFHH